ncbi:MAG TPA: histidine kinase [Burkholderiaceae bacterium]
MQGLFTTRRATLLYLLAWLLLGAILGGIVEVLTGAPRANSMLFALPISLMYGAGAGFSAYYLCRAYPLAERSAFEIGISFTVAALLSGGLWLGMAMLWNELWLLAAVPWASVKMTKPVSALIAGLGVLLYWLAAVGHYLTIEFERARSAERRGLEAKLLAQGAELRMLRTQIDPHFLFNSLNSISALTAIDAGRARTMTVQLADFFRLSLGMAAHTQIPLADEFALVRQFLAIEQVRFGSRLRVVCTLDEQAGACLVPPMLIQPLVENAVKHGIGGLPDGGEITVSARRAGSQLHLLVANPYDADTPPRPGRGHGIGLENVRARLRVAYGADASLSCERREHTYRVALTLPALPAGDAR